MIGRVKTEISPSHTSNSGGTIPVTKTFVTRNSDLNPSDNYSVSFTHGWLTTVDIDAKAWGSDSKPIVIPDWDSSVPGVTKVYFAAPIVNDVTVVLTKTN